MADLLAYLKQHSVCAFNRGDKLYAIEQGTQRTPNGVRNYTVIVMIPSNYQAVRRWLGY